MSAAGSLHPPRGSPRRAGSRQRNRPSSPDGPYCTGREEYRGGSDTAQTPGPDPLLQPVLTARDGRSTGADQTQHRHPGPTRFSRRSLLHGTGRVQGRIRHSTDTRARPASPDGPHCTGREEYRGGSDTAQTPGPDPLLQTGLTARDGKSTGADQTQHRHPGPTRFSRRSLLHGTGSAGKRVRRTHAWQIKNKKLLLNHQP